MGGPRQPLEAPRRHARPARRASPLPEYFARRPRDGPCAHWGPCSLDDERVGAAQGSANREPHLAAIRVGGREVACVLRETHAVQGDDARLLDALYDEDRIFEQLCVDRKLDQATRRPQIEGGVAWVEAGKGKRYAVGTPHTAG